MVSLSPTHITGGVDYGPFPSSEIQLITIAIANTSETEFGINIREDSLVENPEAFHASLRLFTGGFSPFGGGIDQSMLSEPLSETVVTIEDNDCTFLEEMMTIKHPVTLRMYVCIQ